MEKTDIIQVDASNIDTSHICCAISKTPDALACAAAKKNWMRLAFADGYQFHRLNDQGKVLVETIPGENAWAPVCADNWLYIDCFWVSGKFKGQGIASRLLEVAATRAKAEGRLGLCALSSHKKQPFLSDPGFYLHKGFVVADTAPPAYQLLALPFAEGTPLPCFAKSVRAAEVPEPGVCIWCSDHCPHPSKFVPLLEAVAQKKGVPFTVKKVENKEIAQNAPNPFPTYAFFFNNKFITNELFSERKFEEFLVENT